MTLERGLELLAGRRAWEAENGPSPKKTRKKAAAKAKPGDAAPTLDKKCCKESCSKESCKESSNRQSQESRCEGLRPRYE
jgi:DNA topoisomerase-1